MSKYLCLLITRGPGSYFPLIHPSNKSNKKMGAEHINMVVDYSTCMLYLIVMVGGFI